MGTGGWPAEEACMISASRDSSNQMHARELGNGIGFSTGVPFYRSSCWSIACRARRRGVLSWLTCTGHDPYRASKDRITAESDREACNGSVSPKIKRSSTGDSFRHI